MSDPFDDRLRARLDRLTAAIPVEPRSAAVMPTRAIRRRPLGAALAAAAMVVVVSLGATAAFIALNEPAARSGAFAIGGPLHCSGVDQMTPREAERWMTARGLRSPWQQEDRVGDTSATVEGAPDRGFIIDALELDEQTLLVLVDLGREQPLALRSCP